MIGLSLAMIYWKNKILIEISNKLVHAEPTLLVVHPKHTDKSTTVCTSDTCYCKAPSIVLLLYVKRRHSSINAMSLFSGTDLKISVRN